MEGQIGSLLRQPLRASLRLQVIYAIGHLCLPALKECLCPERSRISSFTLAAVEVTLYPLLSDLLNCVAVSFLPSSCGRGSVEDAALIHEDHPTLRSLFRLQCPWLPGQLFLPSPPCRAFYIKKKKIAGNSTVKKADLLTEGLIG